MDAKFGQVGVFWHTMWREHHRFLVQSWVFTAWFLTTLTGLSKMTEPSFPGIVAITLTALTFLSYRYLTGRQLAFRILPPWYYGVWTLCIASKLWLGTRWWWPSLMGICSAPIISQWINDLLARSQGKISLLVAIWAFESLFERAQALLPNVWQRNLMYAPLLFAFTVTLFRVLWASKPPCETPSNTTIWRPAQFVPFTVVGVILTISQAFQRSLSILRGLT